MLKNLKMNIIIKNANDIESGTVYPIVALDIRSNSVTYLDGETEKTISTLRVVAIDIDADDPTIVCVKSEENHASEV